MFITYLHQLLLGLFRKKVSKRRIDDLLTSYTFQANTTLRREVTVDIYNIPEASSLPLRLFCFNDGQDLRTMSIETMMQNLIKKEGLPPFLIVGIHANEKRMQEYGTIRSADYDGRGQLARQHADFISQQLLPYLEKHFTLSAKPIHRAMAGFSLGGLSAFDIAWHHSDLFGCTGVFSGALWWRSKKFDAKHPDANRILHTQAEQEQQLPKLKFWFQAGTLDEKEDRNNNGVIDAIDDTLDLMKILEKRGYHPLDDLHYHEVEGGKHSPKTWSKVMPDFIRWALQF